MEGLSTEQIVNFSFITFPGIFIALMAMLLKKKIGKGLIKYGLFLIGLGIVLIAYGDGNILDLIFLRNVEGSGRAYLVGCMFLFSGLVLELFSGLLCVWTDLHGRFKK